jgi:hypothetical protein
MTTDTEEDIPPIYKYGPWKEINVIYDKNDTRIIEVELIKNINNKEISKTLNKHKWVVKFRPHSVPELYQYLFLVDHNVKNIIKQPVPENNYYNFGATEYGLWYAMKKYIPVTKSLFFVDKWRQLAIAGIKFMQNIHELHHVYLDFKFPNTYYDEELSQFIFGDYDSLSHISDKLLNEYTNDFKYYYLIQGAELDKPCRSFKYDLLSFGYFLAKITCLEKEYEDGYQWYFEKLATNYRKMNGPFTNIDQMCIKNIDKQIIELRNNEHKNFNTFIKNYFEEVNRIDWFLKTCPSKIWYNQLCDIFSFNNFEF